jgi:small subunit ribosomal protein S9
LSTTPLEYYGTGKRKTSVARVHLRPGKGEFQLNDRGLDEYFGGIEALKQVVKQPFSVTEVLRFPVP